jgi:hypothetical protein
MTRENRELYPLADAVYGDDGDERSDRPDRHTG